MNKISETDIHDEIAAELLEAEQEAELTSLRYSSQDVLNSISAEQSMTKEQAYKKLMEEIQKGIDSAEKHGWIPEEEAMRILGIDEDEICQLSDLEETMQDKPMYDPETGLPTDPAYLECGLPKFLQTSLDRMKATWERLDAGIKDIRWDCDYCELQSDINVAEVCGLISEEQAWYLRENYLRIERPGEIP